MKTEQQFGLPRWRWSILAAVLLWLGLSAGNANAAATLRSDHASYVAGEAVQLTFAGGPGNRLDWVGIYPVGVVPGSVGSTQYQYVDGSSGGVVGKSEGTLTFTTPLAEGSWVAYLMEDDGYRVLAQDSFKVGAATAPLVRADKQVYARGEKITIAFNRGPGNVKDWIGIYAEGVEPGPGSTAYKYVDNTADGSTALTDGTITIDAGLAVPGKWVAYLLENDSYTPIAQDSFEVALTGAIVSIQPDHEQYLPGQTIKIAFDGGPGNPTDWIGVYRLGQRPGPVGSTIWNYVSGTQSAGAGLSSGVIEFVNGLSAPQTWRAYFLLNDGYTIAGETTFVVLEATAPIVQTSKRVYDDGEQLSIDFQNAPGNATDWIGVYKKGVNPSSTTATVWNYTDGTRTGTAGIASGTLILGGLAEGEWTAYLFENDSYVVLSQESFTVQRSTTAIARVLSTSPSEGSLASASPDFKAILENRDTTVNVSTLSVKLDDVSVPFTTATDGSKITVTATTSSVFAQGSAHTYTVAFKDSAGADVTATTHFIIQPVVTLTLPTPLFIENFDSTTEGAVPTGWTVSNDSDSQDIAADMGHLGSLAYANFAVVERTRLGGAFLTYLDTLEAAPIGGILSQGNASYVVNGSLVRNFLNGHALVGVSGYHGGSKQILETRTPTYDLSGKSDIHLSFHSLLQQNQDSIAGIEVTTDGGTTWAPVVYYLDPADIIKVDNVIDLEQTYNTQRADIPFQTDGSGGNYGAFLKAPLDSAVAAATQPRGNDDPADGTRVELIRVAAAENQATVQFRLFYVGTDSWYFGVDDFGIYSIATATPEAELSITRGASSLTISWPVLPGYVLQSSTTLEGGSWSNVAGVIGNSYETTGGDAFRFYRLIKP